MSSPGKNEMDRLVRELESKEANTSPAKSTRSKKREAPQLGGKQIGKKPKAKKCPPSATTAKVKKLPTKRNRDHVKGHNNKDERSLPMPPLQASPQPAVEELMQEPLMPSPLPTQVNPVTAPTPIASPIGNLVLGTVATPVIASEEAQAAAAAAISETAPGPNELPPAESTRSSKKASPVTTARQKKKNKQTETQIKKGCRVKIKRKNLFHLLQKDTQKEVLKGFSDNYNCYGQIKSGSANAGYNVEFDIFPFGDKVAFTKRKWLVAVANGVTDEYDRVNDDPKHLDKIESKKKREKNKTPYNQAWQDFVALPEGIRAEATSFEMICNTPGDSITWDILQDDEHVTREEDPMVYPTDIKTKKKIDFGEDGNCEKYADIFFDHFFPDITGHGKKLDKYLSSVQAPMFQTVHNDGIQFHDNDADDPDWIVKQAYLLVLAAATESDVGVENLWKRGRSGGRHDHADFGQYMPQNWFKAFQSGAALMFCEEEHWYVEKRDRPWDIFMPALQGFNDKRRGLFHTVLCMLDESMSGWRPKTSKHGGLPNITFEPRKPVPLGTMLRNCVECISGSMAYQDVVMHPEMQQQKEFFYSDANEQIREPTSLPGNPPMPAHTAEVLRLCKGADMDVGGWTGGDAWFGSVATCVELKKRLGVFSTFVLKKQAQFFPKEVLHSILQARHGDRPAGHWVVMKAVISEVTVLAIAYAWSQKGVSYFVSTCGCTQTSDVKYESKYEDAWGNTGYKLINRPEICHFLYEYLPLIDEHNKQRQSLLALEKRWLTKNVWFRLVTTILGQSTVDMHRFFRYESIRTHGKEHEMIDNIRVLNFSDKICGALKQWPRKVQRPVARLATGRATGSLARITTADGTLTTYQLTAKQAMKGKTVGNSVTLICYVCRGYLDAKGASVYKPTSFWCSVCHMPICSTDRRNDVKSFGAEREMTCLQTHQQSTDHHGCHGNHPRGSEYPEECKISLHPRKSQRKK